MKIAIGNDHHGIELKNKIIDYLNKQNIECINVGCDIEDGVDYVDYAEKVCNCINNNECSLGILICGTGIGMSIAANKIHGIRAGKVTTPEEARLTKEHNHANVMTLSEYTTNVEEIVHNFVFTEYSNEERHLRRVDKIMNLK